MKIILILILILAAIAFFVWALKTIMQSKCPSCSRRGEEGLLIPVIPGWRWWCLGCGGTFTRGHISGEEQLDEDKPIERMEGVEDEDDVEIEINERPRL